VKTIYFEKCSEFQIAIADVMQLQDGAYMLTRINVPAAYRKQGIGTKLLRQVLDEADACAKTLVLEIMPTGEMDYYALRKWYERYGFVADYERAVKLELHHAPFIRLPHVPA
jgi:ribosomal protein S18 acetylase RimI-like enzyme